MPVSHHDGIGIVLLAAGESRRMATSSETATLSQTPAASETNSSQTATPKALLPWLGRPLIQYQLEQIAALGAAQGAAQCAAHVVVTGFHAKRLTPYIESFAGVRIVENPDPARGRASSIVHGVSALPETLTALAVVNVDQPCAAPILKQLMAAQTMGDELITIPRYMGVRGHPPLFSGRLRRKLLQVREETQGLKAVTRAHRADTRYLDVDDPGVVWNLNTPTDYQRAQQQHVLLATTNQAKAAHLAWLLAGIPLRRVTLAEANLPQASAPPETESTLEAIAANKAIAWSRAFGGLAIASDGGISIPALGDRWEERLTARFAGSHATDEQRVRALLALLQPYREEKRRAFFRESVALANNGMLLQTWSAQSTPGSIADSYHPDQLVPGFWLLTLWCDLNTGERVGARTPEDPAYPDGAWARIRPWVQEYVAAYYARCLTPAM